MFRHLWVETSLSIGSCSLLHITHLFPCELLSDSILRLAKMKLLLLFLLRIFWPKVILAITVLPPRVEHLYGDTIIFSCEESHQVVSKDNGDQTYSFNRQRCVPSNDGQVCVMRNVQAEDSGIYFCHNGDEDDTKRISIVNQLDVFKTARHRLREHTEIFCLRYGEVDPNAFIIKHEEDKSTMYSPAPQQMVDCKDPSDCNHYTCDPGLNLNTRLVRPFIQHSALTLHTYPHSAQIQNGEEVTFWCTSHQKLTYDVDVVRIYPNNSLETICVNVSCTVPMTPNMSGWYLCSMNSEQMSYAIPLHVTKNFNIARREYNVYPNHIKVRVFPEKPIYLTGDEVTVVCFENETLALGGEVFNMVSCNGEEVICHHPVCSLTVYENKVYMFACRQYTPCPEGMTSDHFEANRCSIRSDSLEIDVKSVTELVLKSELTGNITEGKGVFMECLEDGELSMTAHIRKIDLNRWVCTGACRLKMELAASGTYICQDNMKVSEGVVIRVHTAKERSSGLFIEEMDAMKTPRFTVPNLTIVHDRGNDSHAVYYEGDIMRVTCVMENRKRDRLQIHTEWSRHQPVGLGTYQTVLTSTSPNIYWCVDEKNMSSTPLHIVIKSRNSDKQEIKTEKPFAVKTTIDTELEMVTIPDAQQVRKGTAMLFMCRYKGKLLYENVTLYASSANSVGSSICGASKCVLGVTQSNTGLYWCEHNGAKSPIKHLIVGK